MIQRIQSVWLFLASMIAGALFIFPLFKYTQMVGVAPTEVIEGVRNYFPLLITAVVVTILPLVTIFLFRDRKRQRGLTILTIILNIGFLALMLMHAANIRSKVGPNVQYLIPGPILPVVSIVFLILALQGIRKDDKLIKSLDRLR